MVRIVVAVLLIVFGGTASAGKPTIAILGLEVRGEGKPDEKIVKFARDLTDQLRNRPKAGTGPYQLAPGSDKDLAELKLLSNCESEAIDCMARIGADLATDWLLYGSVQARSGKQQVTLKLLNVAKKSLAQSRTDLYEGSGGTELATFAKAMYNKVTGALDQATLVIKANVDRATIYLDGEVKGNLTGGLAKIVGLAEGKYKLAVEAEGHLRFEQVVTLRNDGDTTITVELRRR